MKHKILIFILKLLPKNLAHKILYKRHTKKKLDLKNPQDFNEKIQYLIVNFFSKKEANLSDKLNVKEYVSKLKIKDLFIPKTIACYYDVDSIDINKLPSRFVLKCNHGSGNVIICNSKSNFDFEAAKRILKNELKKDYSNNLLEYHYKYIKPCVIAEEYLDDSGNKNPVDYKFYCFNGKVDNILVCTEREKKLKLNDYDKDWNLLDNIKPEIKSKIRVDKPKNLNKMIKMAEELSKGIPFVRVDLYNIDGKIYFGEYTFTPMGGLINYYNDKALKHYGDLIDLKLYKGVKK